MTVSLTLQELAVAAQQLGALQAAKKKAKHAYAIANYLITSVQPIINGYSDSEKEVFTNNGVEPGEDGSIGVTPEDGAYEKVITELAELRSTRVDVPAFPVDVDELIEGMESYDDNPVTEGMFIGLIQLKNGTGGEA